MKPREFDSEELQVGNYFLYEKTIHKVTVKRENSYFKSKWLKDDKFEYSHSNDISCEFLDVTESELIKLGFRKVKTAIILPTFKIQLLRNKYLSIALEQGNTYVSIIEVDSEDETKITDVIIVFNEDFDNKLYIHYIQNLYKSLTNKSLNYET